MDNIKQEIAQIFLEKDNFLISSFESDKIDSVAAILALDLILQKLGKRVFCFVPNLPNFNLSFLPFFEKIKTEIAGQNLIILVKEKNKRLKKINWERDAETLKIELVPKQGDFGPQDISFARAEQEIEYLVFLGSPHYEAIKELEKFKEKPIINIDYHQNNNLYGGFNWISKKSVSMAEPILSLVETLENNSGGKIWDNDLATLLYTSLFWATSGFRGEIPSKTFSVIAQLVSLGANKQKIEKVFERRFSFDFFALLGKIFEKAEYQNQKLISIIDFKRDEKQYWQQNKEKILEEIKNKIFALDAIYIVDSGNEQTEVYVYTEDKNLVAFDFIDWLIKTPPFYKGVSSLRSMKMLETLKQKIF